MDVVGDDGRPSQTWAPIIDGTLRGPQAVFALLLSYARQIGLNAADKVLFIADGAPWTWQRLPRLIAALGLSPTQVLGLIDFYHAAKQLSDAVKLRRWSATQRTRWLNRTRGLLKRARVDEVITALRELCRGRTAGKIRTHLNYFLKNRHRFAYTTMVGLGLPRGSGAVESAIRRVINLRIKGASIYWLPESVDAILLLRSFYKSGQMELFAADGHDAGGCERVTGKSGMRPLEGLRQMRLDPEEGEPALYRALGNALSSPQGACTPVRGGVGLLLQGTADHRRHFVVVIGPGTTGAEFVVQALDAGRSEAPPPLADGVRCDADTLGDGYVRQAFGAGEDDAGPHDQGVGPGSRLSNPLELILLLVGERERGQFASAWHGQAPSGASLPMMPWI